METSYCPCFAVELPHDELYHLLTKQEADKGSEVGYTLCKARIKKKAGAPSRKLKTFRNLSSTPGTDKDVCSICVVNMCQLPDKNVLY